MRPNVDALNLNRLWGGIAQICAVDPEGAGEMIGRLLAIVGPVARVGLRARAVLLTALAAAILVLAGCTSETAAPTGRDTVPKSHQATAGVAVLLTEVRSQANYNNRFWAGYEEPLFALWPDGRLLVRYKGGLGTSPWYLEAQLSAEERAQVAGWIAEAGVYSLKARYPRPLMAWTLMGGEDGPVYDLQVGEGTQHAQVTFDLAYPVGDWAYPARLKMLVQRLQAYRPAGAHPFVHQAVEVQIVVRPRGEVQATGLFPLPAEFALNAMQEVFRNVDEVHYRATYRGEQAGRNAARIDAGETVYVDAQHTYELVYRPLVDWPTP